MGSRTTAMVQPQWYNRNYTRAMEQGRWYNPLENGQPRIRGHAMHARQRREGRMRPGQYRRGSCEDTAGVHGRLCARRLSHRGMCTAATPLRALQPPCGAAAAETMGAGTGGRAAVRDTKGLAGCARDSRRSVRPLAWPVRQCGCSRGAAAAVSLGYRAHGAGTARPQPGPTCVSRNRHGCTVVRMCFSQGA